MRAVGSEHELRRLASRFRAWLRAERAFDVIKDLVALPADEWSGFAGAHAECVTTHVARTVIDRSFAKLGRRPAEAVSLGFLGTRLASELEVRDGPDPLLQGDAWRQYAGALVSSGEYHDAYRACDKAAAFYSLIAPDPPVLECSVLALLRGRALFYLGRSEEALVCVDAARQALRPINAQKFLSAEITYAVVLLGMERIEEAAAIFESAALLARDRNDTASLAYITHSMGGCYARLGMDQPAREYLQSAINEYERLGLKAETLHSKTGLVRVLIHEGKYNEAIASLFEIRNAYFALDMPVPAADTGLWILDVLFLANRLKDVPSLGAELLKVFRSKKLPREAVKALGYLNESLGRGVTKKEVQRVRTFMGRLAGDADAVFLAPARTGG